MQIFSSLVWRNIAYVLLFVEHNDETCDEFSYTEVFVGKCYYVEVFASKYYYAKAFHVIVTIPGSLSVCFIKPMGNSFV